MRDAVVHYERVRDVLVARQRPGGAFKPPNPDAGRLYAPPLPKRGLPLGVETSHHYTPSQPQDLPMKGAAKTVRPPAWGLRRLAWPHTTSLQRPLCRLRSDKR